MKSAIKDHMTTLVTVTVLACVAKFLMQGVTFDVFGHAINLGSADALTYGALLTPVLGAHGYIQSARTAPITAAGRPARRIK